LVPACDEAKTLVVENPGLLPIHTKIPLSLPQDERNGVFSKIEFVHLSPGQVILIARETITCGYFIETGVISILAE